MSQADREKWEARYAEPPSVLPEVLPLLCEQAHRLPRQGRALDVAGGLGQNALWLAQRGLQATLLDISTRALEFTRQQAQRQGLPLAVQCADLDDEALPSGPWDAIVCSNFLCPILYASAAELLAPGGVLCISQPTTTNLQRHAKPPLGFLIEPDILPQRVPGLQIEYYAEGWHANDRHEARLIARRLV